MSVTILEGLQNAEYNLKTNCGGALGQFGFNLAKNQLHNAITLLEKGYSLDDEIEPLLEKYGDIEKVPEKKESQ